MVFTSSVVLPEPGLDTRFSAKMPRSARRWRLAAAMASLLGQDVLLDLHLGATARSPARARRRARRPRRRRRGRGRAMRMPSVHASCSWPCPCPCAWACTVPSACACSWAWPSPSTWVRSLPQPQVMHMNFSFVDGPPLQATSISVTRISSPCTTCSWWLPQCGQASPRRSMGTWVPQGMHQASPGRSTISSREPSARRTAGDGVVAEAQRVDLDLRQRADLQPHRLHARAASWRARRLPPVAACLRRATSHASRTTSMRKPTQGSSACTASAVRATRAGFVARPRCRRCRGTARPAGGSSTPWARRCGSRGCGRRPARPGAAAARARSARPPARCPEPRGQARIQSGASAAARARPCSSRPVRPAARPGAWTHCGRRARSAPPPAAGCSRASAPVSTGRPPQVGAARTADRAAAPAPPPTTRRRRPGLASTPCRCGPGPARWRQPRQRARRHACRRCRASGRTPAALSIAASQSAGASP